MVDNSEQSQTPLASNPVVANLYAAKAHAANPVALATMDRAIAEIERLTRESEAWDKASLVAIIADRDRLRAALQTSLRCLQAALGPGFKVEPLPQDSPSETSERPIVDLDAEQAFEAGWRAATSWTDQDDLLADIGSSAYHAAMTEEFERMQGRKPERHALKAPEAAAKSEPMLTLNGYQLKNALEFCAPDGTPEQLESDVTIQYGNGHSGPGHYVSSTEYADEGSILLDDSMPAEDGREEIALGDARYYQPPEKAGEKS